MAPRACRRRNCLLQDLDLAGDLAVRHIVAFGAEDLAVSSRHYADLDVANDLF